MKEEKSLKQCKLEVYKISYRKMKKVAHFKKVKI